MVTGILIFTNIFDSRSYLSNNGIMRYMFGAILIVYGIFRAYNSYLKLTAKKKQYHYWRDEEDE